MSITTLREEGERSRKTSTNVRNHLKNHLNPNTHERPQTSGTNVSRKGLRTFANNLMMKSMTGNNLTFYTPTQALKAVKGLKKTTLYEMMGNGSLNYEKEKKTPEN